METMDVHAEDGCTASYVQDDFALEDVLVVVDGVAVGASAHFVFLFNRHQPELEIDVRLMR